MPLRTSRKSTRPRASDRSMVATIQPYGLMRFETDRRRRYYRRCSYCDGTTRARTPDERLPWLRGAGGREINLRIRRREKNVLDIPSLSKNTFKRESPRSGIQVWRLFFGVIGFVAGGIFPHSTR